MNACSDSKKFCAAFVECLGRTHLSVVLTSAVLNADSPDDTAFADPLLPQRFVGPASRERRRGGRAVWMCLFRGGQSVEIDFQKMNTVAVHEYGADLFVVELDGSS